MQSNEWSVAKMLQNFPRILGNGLLKYEQVRCIRVMRQISGKQIGLDQDGKGYYCSGLKANCADAMCTKSPFLLLRG